MFRAIGNAFKAVLNSQIGRALVQIAICSFGAPACVAASAAITLATGGSIGDAVKAAAWSFAQVEIWTGVGKVLSGALQGSSALAAVAAKGLVHGTIGGALSVAQSGSFYEGFAANGIGGAVGMVTHQSGIDSNIYLDTAIVATAGGLSAEITGGKFENGAITAGFAHLFNAENYEEKFFYDVQMGVQKFGQQVGNAVQGLYGAVVPGYAVVDCAGSGACSSTEWAMAAAGAFPGAKVITIPERAGLRQLFGKSVEGAQDLLRSIEAGAVKIPESVSAATLKNYREIAENHIAKGLDNNGVQALRIEAIDQLIRSRNTAMVVNDVHGKLTLRGVDLGSPATSESVADLEATLNTTIDPAIRSLYLAFDGFCGGDHRSQIELWPIARILALEIPGQKIDNRTLFAVGDILIDSDFIVWSMDDVNYPVYLLNEKRMLARSIQDFFCQLTSGTYDIAPE